MSFEHIEIIRPERSAVEGDLHFYSVSFKLATFDCIRRETLRLRSGRAASFRSAQSILRRNPFQEGVAYGLQASG